MNKKTRIQTAILTNLLNKRLYARARDQSQFVV